MPSSITSSDPARVLLVDDNEAMLARAALVLEPEFAVVGQVHDGQAALDAVEALHPDVMVLDISMPGMSGFEVATRLRRAGSPTAVVFLSVHAEEAFVAAAMASGAVGYVIKPRLVSDLGEAVRVARDGRAFVSPREGR